MDREYDIRIRKSGNLFQVTITNDLNQIIDEIDYWLEQNHNIRYLMCPQSRGYLNGDFETTGSIKDIEI